MTKKDPDWCDYLAVVSEWSSTGMGGGLVGNAIPILNLTTGEVVASPQDEFPNPGAIFLMSRGNLETWDFIVVRPRKNDRYKDAGERDCYYLYPRQPVAVNAPTQTETVAVVLDHPTFDLHSNLRQLVNPRHNVTPLFYVLRAGTYYGPLLRTQTQLSQMDDVQRIDWSPFRDDGVVYEFTRDELTGQGIRLMTYSHPNPSLNRVLHSSILVAVGKVRTAASGRPRDAMPAAKLIEWYLQHCPTLEITPALMSSLKTAFKGDTHDDPAIVEARLRTVQREMATNAAFLEQRERFARQYLESEAGQKRLQELFEQAVARKGTEIQAEVDRRQSQLASARNELDRQLTAAQEEHRQRLAALQREQEALRHENDGLRDAVSKLQRDLKGNVQSLATRMQQELPLFAALATVARPPIPEVRTDGEPHPGNAQPTVLHAPAAVLTPQSFRPIPPTVPVKPVANEAKLVSDLHANLARQGLHFARDFVANVYACLKAEALNLIIGPPGYGKSMLVTALARALGHGNALLRIAVRRSWGEDRYLLGFFDSFHNRYDPGATGLVPRMLQAEADWQGSRTGVYIVLLDEFNLAAPEYYFSQLLQVLPSDDPAREVMLYDPGRAGHDGYPSRVGVGPNLRFWGTINYDETTERLSPRTLDRTGMIFLGDADVKRTLDDDLPAMPAVAAGELFGKFLRTPEQCPEDRWELVSQVIDLLRSPDDALGPRVELSPRVRRAIRRYLANSADVLDPRAAVDFAVQQRILPVVRGRGDDFLARIRRVGELLSEANLPRSARHVEEALQRSEQQFGELDFLTY
jgi:hypothetical protein